jgi:hypothetical protein
MQAILFLLFFFVGFFFLLFLWSVMYNTYFFFSHIFCRRHYWQTPNRPGQTLYLNTEKEGRCKIYLGTSFIQAPRMYVHCMSIIVYRNHNSNYCTVHSITYWHISLQNYFSGKGVSGITCTCIRRGVIRNECDMLHSTASFIM